MRVLVYPHLMEIGGSQLNAIELAYSISKRGHDVVVFAPDGALVDVVHTLGLEYVEAPSVTRWPSATAIGRLRKMAKRRRFDIVHAYEWGPAVDVLYGIDAGHSAACVATVMSMSVPTLIPRHWPLVVGTRALADEQQALGRVVHLMEPPIDTVKHSPGGAEQARRRLGIQCDELVFSVVCRLTSDLGKLEGVLSAVDVAAELDAIGLEVRLVIAGGGAGLAELRERASRVNTAAGRTVVQVTGPMLDPGDAYLAADVVIGMGSSVLKGMAYQKPVVVQGERGFWRTLDEQSLAMFLRDGWWGTTGGGSRDLFHSLLVLFRDGALRQRLGQLSRRVVTDRFSLVAAARRLDAIYEDALGGRPPRSVALKEGARSSFELAKFRADRMLRERIGETAVDSLKAAVNRT